jgi:hypothetical protein
VLDLRHHVLRLDALDLGHAHLAVRKRVFAEGVVAAAEFQVAVDVHKGLQRDVDAQRAVFAADHQAVLFGSLALKVAATPMVAVSPATDGASARPEARRQSAARNAQPRNAGQIAGLALVDRRDPPACRGSASAFLRASSGSAACRLARRP